MYFPYCFVCAASCTRFSTAISSSGLPPFATIAARWASIAAAFLFPIARSRACSALIFSYIYQWSSIFRLSNPTWFWVISLLRASIEWILRSMWALCLASSSSCRCCSLKCQITLCSLLPSLTWALCSSGTFHDFRDSFLLLPLVVSPGLFHIPQC